MAQTSEVLFAGRGTRPECDAEADGSLAEKGLGGEQLREIERMIDAEKSDLYDVLAYIAFALSPITRQERADARKVEIFSHYNAKIEAFQDFVLSQ